MTTNDTPHPLRVPATTETNLEALRRIISNLDHLDEDSAVQALYLVRNSQIIGDALSDALRKVGAMPQEQFLAAGEYLDSF